MRKNFVLTPLVVMLAAGAAFAQDTATAVLTGRVTSSKDGKPLAGARIRIESPSMLGVRNATTDASGNFRVSLLPNGEYSILYTLDGYFTRKVTMRLVAGQTANGSVQLNTMNVQEETIEITARPVAVDKTDTVVATTFSADYLEKIVGRGLGALGTLAPGLNTSDLNTQGTLNIRGGTGRSTKTLLNGNTITEAYGGYNFGTFALPDLIESVALIQSPLNSRYGNSDGGIISMVTSKGSNTFTGTIRVTGIGRSYWSVLDQGYPQRDGTLGGRPPLSTTDLLGKTYDVSVSGPLWKDHITFAYGGRLSPASYSTPLYGTNFWNTVQGAEVPFWSSSNRGRPSDNVGTFYEDPTNGVIIRKPEMWLANTPEGRFNQVNQTVYNQFTVFGQITPSHQVEYNHTQRAYTSRDDTQGSISVSGDPWNHYSTGNRAWNAVYKGVIGSFGVLDANYGKSGQFWKYGDRAGYPDTWPIRSYSIASRVPRDGNRNNNNFNNYWSNGYAWAGVNQRIANSNLAGSGSDSNNYNQQAGYGFQTAYGKDLDDVDASESVSLSVNYQHFLKTANWGSHMFDIGVNGQEFQWVKKASGAVRRYEAMGLIANDLALADIYNPRGVSLTQAMIDQNYAGRYIVFNVATATLNDVDPYAVTRFNLPGDIRFADRIVRNQGPLPGLFWGNPISTNPSPGDGTNFAPKVLLREGDFSGTYNTNMMSYYLNDLWTINDNHSVQAGLRIDNFEVVSTGKTFFTYSQPTIRLEYKWDLHGDQSRLVNVSYGQFHSMMPAGLFASMIDSKGAVTRTVYWQGQGGSSRPYLVTKDALMNPANYGLQGDWSTPISAGSTLENIPSIGGSSTYGVDPNWKAPISTEFQLGFRRNLTLGGTWKATFVYRTWINDFDFFPGEIVTVPSGTSTQKIIKRILKNAEGYERKYTGIELEWDYPVFKRVTFGGSYTFNRLMSNTPDVTDSSGAVTGPGLNLDTYWDYMVGETFGVTGDARRLLWRKLRPINPEHYFKWYLLFDLSSGKIQESIAFRGDYTSGAFQNRTFNYQFGFPTDFDPRYRELILGTSGGNVTSPDTSGTAGFGSSQYLYVLNNSVTASDGWGLNMRYSLSVPISKKLRLLANVDVSSPFNHRGLGGWYGISGGADTAIRPVALTTGANVSSSGQYTVYGVDNDHTKNVWRPNLPNTGHNSNFQSRQGGRSMSLEAGLRF